MKTEDRIAKIEHGEDFKVYEYLGSHLATKGGKQGAYFRVYSPHAKEIFVVGEFNNWDKTANPLKRIKNSNIWETFIEKAKNGQEYKYIVIDELDKEHVKCDQPTTLPLIFMI